MSQNRKTYTEYWLRQNNHVESSWSDEGQYAEELFATSN